MPIDVDLFLLTLPGTCASWIWRPMPLIEPGKFSTILSSVSILCALSLWNVHFSVRQNSSWPSCLRMFKITKHHTFKRVISYSLSHSNNNIIQRYINNVIIKWCLWVTTSSLSSRTWLGAVAPGVKCSRGICEDVTRGLGKTTWLGCLVAISLLRKETIRAGVEWVLAVVKFWVTFIEHFKYWDSTK